MRDIIEFIEINMKGRSLEDIEDYLYTFLEDEEITEEQFERLVKWAEKFCELYY